MSWITRSGFCRVVLFVSIFFSLPGSLAMAQQSLSSGADRAQSDTFTPAEIPASSAASDAQATAAGTITGTVLDANREALEGAHVTVAGQSSSVARTLDSGNNGQFAFTGLPPDTYKLTVTAPGMNSFTSAQISLHGGETRIVSAALSVFGGTTSVTVSGNKEELAEQQVQIAERQRIGGVIPNFYSSYDWNAPPLGAKQKLKLSFRTVFDPVSLFTMAGVAGAEQYRNTSPGYGTGIRGYGKRYGANLADDVTGTILSRGVYPSIFHQDPRYFYKGTGSIHSRILYAMSAAVIARGDDGRWKPNYSHVLGTFSAAGISTFYAAASDRGASSVLLNGLVGTGASAVSNLLREFVFKRVTTHVPEEPNSKR